MGHRDKKLLYHLTDVANLRGILARGLQSRRSLESSGHGFADHADSEILEGRAEHRLDALVPFHFLARNPFDYAVVRNASSKQFVLITVARSHARANGWLVIPRHPLSAAQAPEVLDWESGMERIDWAQMDKQGRDWEADHECKLACMAEALSPTTVAAQAFHALYVASESTQTVTAQALREANLTSCHLNLSPQMFPKGAR
jgi:hypothetical protein